MEDLERIIRDFIETDSNLSYNNYDEYNPPLLNISDYIDTEEREP